MQDLKCGHIVGATPWKQQVFQVVGVVAAAFVIPFVLNILDQGYGRGRVSPLNPEATMLAAPQAGLMQALASGIFGAGIEWGFIFIGFGLAVALIILDKIQEKRGSDFRFPVLAVAVGVYLPLGLSVPIFMGGILAHVLKKKAASQSADKQQVKESSGLLLASGLITGEALMGVLVAIAAVSFQGMVPYFSFSGAWWCGVVVFIAVTYYIYSKVQRS